MDRERYAKNKDDILKRRRQSRELKKQSTRCLRNLLSDVRDYIALLSDRSMPISKKFSKYFSHTLVDCRSTATERTW
jgi:hypothetical protein